MISNIIFPANSRRDEIVLKRVNSVTIESSWEMLTDTAEIVIPRALFFKNRVLKDQIKVADEVIIQLGYDFALVTEFEGLITKVLPDAPVVLKCEDYMWQLKQIYINKSWKRVNLKDLIREVIPEWFDVDVIDIPLGTIKVERSTVASLLKYLKDEYRIYSYFKGQTLVSGKVYTDDVNKAKFGFEKNIVSHDLVYRFEDELKIKVTAESFNSNGTTLSVTVGDEDGAESKLIYRNIESETELKRLAENDLERMKISGYEGTLTSFGIPVANHGEIAQLESSQYPERDGDYYIDAVRVEFTESPSYRRVLTIGKQA